MKFLIINGKTEYAYNSTRRLYGLIVSCESSKHMRCGIAYLLFGEGFALSDDMLVLDVRSLLSVLLSSLQNYISS